MDILKPHTTQEIKNLVHFSQVEFEHLPKVDIQGNAILTLEEKAKRVIALKKLQDDFNNKNAFEMELCKGFEKELRAKANRRTQFKTDIGTLNLTDKKRKSKTLTPDCLDFLKALATHFNIELETKPDSEYRELSITLK